MQTKLAVLQGRLDQLDDLARDVASLAEKHRTNGRQSDDAQPNLAIKAQRWFRGTRALLEEYKFSDLGRFDVCFRSELGWEDFVLLSRFDPSHDYRLYINFQRSFLEARSLQHGVFEEVASRELSVAGQLSFAVVADEFATARELMDASGDEPIIRAAGVVARIALERHLFTVADARAIQIQVNPPTKKKTDVSDLLTTFVRAKFITAVQKSELDSLFAVGNNCAHPKELVTASDVDRLIRRGKELAAIIV